MMCPYLRRYCEPPGTNAPRRGAIMVWAVLCLTMVMAFIAFSVDLGFMVVTVAELQNAADSGALSGARAIPQGRDAALAAARNWTARNEAAGQSVSIQASDIELGVWDDKSASFTELPSNSLQSPDSVRVTARRTSARGNPLGLFFARFIGTEHADVSATATAKIERDICGLFVGLKSVNVQNATVDSYDSSKGKYWQQTSQHHGDICSNGPIQLSPSGRIKGDARPGAGHTVNSPSQVSGSTTPRTRPISWEPVQTLGPSQANNNNRIPAWALDKGGKRLDVSGPLTLEPGTYYLPEGLNVHGSGLIIVTGPTKLVLGGEVKVAGAGIVNQTLAPAHLRIEIVSSSAKFAGSVALFADIYAPTTDVEVLGTSGFYGAIFAGRIDMNGSSARLHGDESLRRNVDSYTTRSTLRD